LRAWRCLPRKGFRCRVRGTKLGAERYIPKCFRRNSIAKFLDGPFFRVGTCFYIVRFNLCNPPISPFTRGCGGLASERIMQSRAHEKERAGSASPEATPQTKGVMLLNPPHDSWLLPRRLAGNITRRRRPSRVQTNLTKDCDAVALLTPAAGGSKMRFGGPGNLGPGAMRRIVAGCRGQRYTVVRSRRS